MLTIRTDTFKFLRKFNLTSLTMYKYALGAYIKADIMQPNIFRMIAKHDKVMDKEMTTYVQSR